MLDHDLIIDLQRWAHSEVLCVVDVIDRAAPSWRHFRGLGWYAMAAVGR